MTLSELVSLFRQHGCISLYAKRLAANDNSKNQIYFGPGFGALNLLPNQGPVLNEEAKTPNYKAALDFYWLNTKGEVNHAPGAQLILYPDYPEVRFSGFLQRAVDAPNELLASRLPDRILFLGITPEKRIIGYVFVSSDALPQVDGPDVQRIGVFSEVPLTGDATKSSRELLLVELRRIHLLDWIVSKQLSSDGTINPCNAIHCGGFTLEAELGIPKNSKGAPDYLGYEVKQHDEKRFDRVAAHAITLMTPEPKGGFYREKGSEQFLRRFGYADKSGKPDRINFGGVHRVGVANNLTGLTLSLPGFDPTKGTFEANGSIALLTKEEEVAASWPFAEFLEHWQLKHAKAVYVPSMKTEVPERMYKYGHTVRIGEQTDFIMLLKAFHAGAVYFDPGMKIEQASTPKAHKKVRSQFRINSQALGALYRRFDSIHLIDG